MHSYYAENKEKFKAGMGKFLIHISPELEKISGRSNAEIFDEIWDYYEKNLLERFPYIGGGKVSGTKNLTGAYYFVAMNAPLYRKHTCFDDGDYCDFKLKLDAGVLSYWPPVFTQDNPYK